MSMYLQGARSNGVATSVISHTSRTNGHAHSGNYIILSIKVLLLLKVMLYIFCVVKIMLMIADAEGGAPPGAEEDAGAESGAGDAAGATDVDMAPATNGQTVCMALYIVGQLTVRISRLPLPLVLAYNVANGNIRHKYGACVMSTHTRSADVVTSRVLRGEQSCQYNTVWCVCMSCNDVRRD
ncbi:hypothetical protein HF086_006197 [Spodoptera exigua]|uniref:Uncharacterized protein n=1 Tax=Spodoptera exigua TaxID=7107 RepID=A0A922MCV9_SPOEX|nr:hypothetical protein HF086_006197 [Spodoptera exigua]